MINFGVQQLETYRRMQGHINKIKTNKVETRNHPSMDFCEFLSVTQGNMKGSNRRCSSWYSRLKLQDPFGRLVQDLDADPLGLLEPQEHVRPLCRIFQQQFMI